MNENSKRIAFFVCILLFVAVLYVISANNDPLNKKYTVSNTSNVNTVPIAPIKEKTYDWKEVFNYNGSESVTTDTFQIQGSKFKITYSQKLDPDTYSSLYVSPKSTKNNISSNSFSTQKENGESFVYASGEFYLDILASSTEYSLQVFDYIEAK
jgi:hypothetical protein